MIGPGSDKNITKYISYLISVLALKGNSKYDFKYDLNMIFLNGHDKNRTVERSPKMNLYILLPFDQS